MRWEVLSDLQLPVQPQVQLVLRLGVLLLPLREVQEQVQEQVQQVVPVAGLPVLPPVRRLEET